MKTLLITYKSGNTYTLKNVLEYSLDEENMYYRTDDVAFIGHMPWSSWPLENVASIQEVVWTC